MPLIQSSSKEALAKNIAELHRANESKSPAKRRPNDQIIAIAYSVSRKAKEKK